MAVCDAQYKFSLVDVGDSGRHSDRGRGVLSNSTFGKAISNGTLYSVHTWNSYSVPFRSITVL